MSLGEQTRGLVELTRPGNAIAAGILTLTGAFVAQGVGVIDTGMAVAASTGATILATGAGNAINDYFDKDIDRINKPERPIPRGAIDPQIGLIFSIALFIVAAGLALTLPVVAIAIATVNIIALMAYTEFFKGLPGIGNALVAYLGGSTFLFGGAAVGNVRATVVLALLAALSTFAREVIKDVEDLTGDREEGLNTLPIAMGENQALVFAAVALVVALVASPVPYFMGTFGVVYVILVVPADLVMLYAGYASFKDPGVGQSVLKYGMYLAAAAFIGSRIVMLFG